MNVHDIMHLRTDNGFIFVLQWTSYMGYTVRDRIPVRARFSAPVQTGPGVHPASGTMGTGSFPGGKERPGGDADPSPLSSAVVKKE